MKFKSHFVFNRNQQNGVLLLVVLIIILQVVLVMPHFSSRAEPQVVTNAQIDLFQKKIDSLKRAKTEKPVELSLFNPNYLTDFKGYTLGMSPEEIDRLLSFRSAGKWINSAQDFQAVTGVSDSLLNRIAPLFKFPEWVRQSQQDPVKPGSPVSSRIMKKDLNVATAGELMEVNGIGEVLAQRIVNYRNKLGGFADEIQLKDIYGLSYETRGNILKTFSVLTKPEIIKKSLKSIGVLELSEVPYFNYELAREIINYRQLHGGINSFEELSKINSFPTDKIDRIELYLTID
ncbi:ComEA family DNA-binding protein [Zunongwangia sp. H14]|uniref:ComEA family DNA-binding protein n=1 Tax=Zunongwangia sp. H14 TaxID=3240792 RepID=UPI0035625E06